MHLATANGTGCTAHSCTQDDFARSSRNQLEMNIKKEKNTFFGNAVNPVCVLCCVGMSQKNATMKDSLTHDGAKIAQQYVSSFGHLLFISLSHIQ